MASNPKTGGGLSRRDFLSVKVGALSLAGAAGLAALGRKLVKGSETYQPIIGAPGHAHHEMGTVGTVSSSDFDPIAFLSDFDWGVLTQEGGRAVRTYDLIASDKEIEVAPGVFFPAWTYNGRVPGPTIRCRAGDWIRVRFVNAGSHPHTIHFHGIHPVPMDGIEPILPGSSFVYEFEAQPFGLHLYHCHAIPLKRHIHKGLYGAFIIDPPQGRPAARELTMVMNGFDTNFDGENEVYAVNTVAFAYMHRPIPVAVGDLVRIYLINATEFDPINSFHLHANMYKLFRTGTDLEHFELTDNVIMGQGERHVLEMVFPSPGRYMFHAHQSEFAELGWMGFIEAA
jgi:FtsP/CotA-like multicopper oxidase with cupredoxin domain